MDFLSPVTLGVVAAAVAISAVTWMLLRWLTGRPVEIARRKGLLILRAATVLALLALLLNPVRVQELPGSVDPPDVFCLLDASTSMAMGTGDSRWEDSARFLRDATEQSGSRSHARLNLFRFGQKLSAIEPSAIGLTWAAAVSLAKADAKATSSGPTDSDTQLAGALRQLSSRFGKSLPAGIVVFSDGQARDAADVEKVAKYFAKLGVPIHAVPVGDTGKGGDVAIVGVVAPDRVRKFSQVDVQVFLRSYGYDGRRVDLALWALGDDGKPQRRLSSLPIILRRGIQSAALSFQSDAQTRKLQVAIEPQSDEISTENNRFATEVAIDRTKIRVLYIEGNVTRYQQVQKGDRLELRGAYSELQEALSEDPDIECVVLAGFPGSSELRRIGNSNFAAGDRGFPDTVAELSAFDAILFSNVTREVLTEKQLEWVEQWVSQRGGGIAMLGGQFSFAGGSWRETAMARMLPVELASSNEDWLPGDALSLQPALSDTLHPIWHMVADEKQNQEILRTIPPLNGSNRFPAVKPNLTTVLATTAQSNGDPVPALVAGRYSRGRTLALAGAVTTPWANEFLTWGQNDRRHYSKFWRNVIYWLTESSSIGRRRLLATADKKFYRPGETLSLSALAYDEGANRTTDYRVVAMIEPASASADITSDYSPVRWPDGMQRTSGEEGPFIAWGEEFELTRKAGNEGYDMTLPLAETLSAAAGTQGLRVEVTAYEDQTQVDSTSLSIQVLDDPFELQNPFPNHDLLRRLAQSARGEVFSSPGQLAEMLRDLPVKVGAPVIRKTPLWSRWWLAAMILGLLSVEWMWRRSVGLA